MKGTFQTTGEYWQLMLRVFRKPEKWSIFWRQFWKESQKLIIGSLLLVFIVSIAVGGVICLQTANNLESPFIPKYYVGVMARESLVLEFCSTMIALILAGKMGSNIASEIGSMRITEQIDAMEIMGVNSANFLILPKIISATVFSPFLMLMSFFIGLAGGGALIAITGIITLAQYIEGLQFAFNQWYIFYSMIKMAVFCFIITSISSYYGYYAKGGSLGVGKSSTQAIVISSMLILIFDLILTKLLL
ncbi:MAG: ABC transporter permease [Bacteroidales bacterium]|nr:ABC transporter permease [Bacteroidales bacterium]